MAMTEYIDERYQETFDSVYQTLWEMALQQPEETLAHIRQTLKSLYIRSGNDWTGRGAIGNAGLDASIAAHESVLLVVQEQMTQRRNVS